MLLYFNIFKFFIFLYFYIFIFLYFEVLTIHIYIYNLARTPEIGQGLGRILSCGARKQEQT